MLLDLYEGKRILNLIISDRGRFFVSLFALDLHFRCGDDGTGLTPGRLKEMCREQGICSATRADAVLTLMKLAGYIERAPGARDRRLREFVPTEKLIANLRKRWHCHLAPAAALLPDAAQALGMLGRPEFVRGVVRLISAHYCAGFRFIDHVPALRRFADHNGGLMVLFSCLAAGNEDDPGPQYAASVSVSQLARSINASRAHVGKLLKEAESEGLIKRPDGGGIVLMPDLVDNLHEFFALNYLILTHFAKTTRDHLGAAPESGWPRPAPLNWGQDD
jgi:DNA-binding MarR family transcriptional regulator